MSTLTGQSAPPLAGADRQIVLAAYGSAALAMLCWSGSFVTARGVYESVPPIGLNYWRTALATVLFLAVGYRQLRSDWPAIRAQWKKLAALGFFNIVMGNTAIFVGLQTTTAINGGVINSMSPVFVLVVALLILGEPIRRLRAVGVGFALAGVALLISRADSAVLLGLAFTPGDLWILIAVFGWGLYSVFLKKWAPGLHFLSLTAASTVFGLILLTPFYLWEHVAVRSVVADTTTVLAVGYLGVFASWLAVLAHTRAIQMVGPSRIAPFSYLVPVFTIVMGIAFLGEAFKTYHAGGIAVIAIGIYLTTRGGARLRH